jgi:hypothetical protein
MILKNYGSTNSVRNLLSKKEDLVGVFIIKLREIL